MDPQTPGERPERRSPLHRWATIAVAAVLALTAVAVAVQIAGARPSPPGDSATPAGGSSSPTAGGSPSAAPAPGVSASPAPLSVARGDRVLIFGDSYTSGYGATPPTDGYAYQMGGLTGWNVVVDGMGGTGYLNPGPDGQHTFLQRIDALAVDDYALIILEGGSNDQRVQDGDFSGAVEEVVTALQQRFPTAQLVLVGPAAVVGNENADKARIDDALRRVSADRSLHYISPFQERWFPAGEDSPYVNWDVGHPNNAGYALYATHLRDDLAALS